MKNKRDPAQSAALITTLALGVCALVVLLAGCAAQPMTRIVQVEHTEYVPIPTALTRPCNPADLSVISTNGNLVTALLHDSAEIENCNAQLRQIRGLQAPSSATR
jgi:hypothetical protein